MKPEDFDYSNMVNDLELVNSIIKTVWKRETVLGDSKTTVDIIHINGLSYMDMETDCNGPIMKATLLHKGDSRLHLSNFKDKIKTHYFGDIKETFLHYYSKNGGKTWKPITPSRKPKVYNYA
jgi:L-ascorbate metabolism protein UlaG (beta-lactamase superfamily)